MGCKKHGRQRPRSLVSRPQQSPLYWALKCILQIARPAILVPIVLAQLLEPPYTDPYVRWCGRGGAERLPPIPIVGTKRNCRGARGTSGAGGRPAVPAASRQQPPLTQGRRYRCPADAQGAGLLGTIS